MESSLLFAKRAAKGKRASREVARFMLDPVPRLERLLGELQSRDYKPGLPRGFVVTEPKRRLISALPFRDRVVQHYLVAQTLPALERSFARQSYACRQGKGTHRALRRACELQRSHAWLLRLDIAKFFPSIDHEQLLRMLLPASDVQLHWLIRRVLGAPAQVERVLFHFPGDDLLSPIERPHGLPWHGRNSLHDPEG